MAKTYNAGTIFLQVVPVFGDAMDAIKRQAEDANRAWGDKAEKAGKEAGERAGKAQGEAMVKEAKKSGEKAGDNYAGAFQEKIKASLRGAQREIDTLNFKTLSDDAEDRVKRIGKLFKELDAEITPDMDDKKVRAKLDFLRADLKKLTEGKHELHIDENLGEVIGKVEGGLKVIDKALDKRRVIEIETKISDRDLGSFEKKLRDTARRSAKALGDSLDPTLKKLKARLDALADSEIGIDITSGAARAEIIAIDKALESLPKEIDVDLGVNAAVAHAELLALRTAINDIDGMDVDIPVKVHGTARAAAELAATGAAAGGMRAALIGAFQAGSGGAENAANSFRSFNFVILAAVTLIPALIPMIGALGGGLLALIPILGAVGAGLGTMLLGFSGIGDAVSALGDVQDNAAKDALSAGKTMTSAANSVADAERALAEARRSAGQAAADAARAVKDAERAAAQAIEDAIDRKKDAQEAYRDSVKAVAEAERDLAEARREALYELQDLDNQVEQNQIDIGQQTIDVFEAQVTYDQTMADPTATNQDRDAAALALQEAMLRLKELRQEQERLAEEKAKADKDGVKSTDTVKNAQDALTAALEGQKDAQDDLRDASEAVTEAQIEGARRVADAERNLARTRAAGARSVADAQRNLTRAQQSYADAVTQTGELGSASMQKLDQAMSKLGPSGRKFARFLFSLRGDFYRLRDAVQAALLPPVQHAIETILNKYGPQIGAFAVSMAGSVGGLFDKLANRMTKSPAWQNFFGMMAEVGPALLDSFGTAVINGLQIFASLMTAIAPYSVQLADALARISKDVAQWMASDEGLETWQSFMAYATEVAPLVIDFFENLFKAALNIGEALAPWGAMVLAALSGILGFIGSMDPKTLGLITTAIIALTIAFQAAVGIVALAYAGAAVFATTAGATVFAVVLLAATLAVLYHRFETVRDIVHAVTGFLSDHRELLLDIVKIVGLVFAAYQGFLVAKKIFMALKAAIFAVRFAVMLLNLAMYANPIGLVVLAIIALIAVFVLLFKHNKTFRDLVLKVWGAIKKAAVVVWGAVKDAFWATVHAIQDAWDWLKPIFVAIGSAFVSLWHNYIAPALTGIWQAVKSAFNFIKSLWNNVLWPIIDLIGTVIFKLWKLYFKANFLLIKLAFKALVWAFRQYWNHYLKPIFEAFGKAIKWLWENIVKPNIPKIVEAWNKVKDAFHTAWKDYIQPALGAMKTGLQNVWEKVNNVVGWIKDAWDGMKKIFAAPIYFMLKTVINDGIVAGFNKIADFVGSDNMGGVPQNVLDAVNPDKFASGGIYGRRKGGRAYAGGGVMPGYTPGQDVHHFVSPTAGSLHLSGGEAIMRPEFTSVVGSGWVDKMNLIARAEGRSGIKRVMGGQAYARGGIFFPLPGGHIEQTAYNLGHNGVDINVGSGDDDLGMTFYSATTGNVLHTGYGRGYGNAVFVNSPYGELVYGHSIDGSIKVGVGQGVSPGTPLAQVGQTGNASGPHLHFGFAQNGTFGRAMALLSGAPVGKPGKSGGGIHVPGWIKSFVKGPFDYFKGLISKPINALKDKFDGPIIDTLTSIPVKMAKSVAHKAYDLLPGPVKAAAKGAGAVVGAAGDAANGALDAVGLKTGGILPYNGTMKYDSGGYLPPGLTSVMNLTGKPEPVFTHDQFDKMSTATGEVFHYEPHFEGSDLTAADVVRDMDHARRKMRREGRYARH